jgi:heme-degrading monooxygenase HmoA
MHIAMNRFTVAPGREEVFEEVWRSRDSQLDQVPGFREFHLLRGPAGDEGTVFVSHSLWDSRDAFVAWTDSEAFRAAHGKSRMPEGTLLGPPRFEGFDVVL